MFSCVVIVVSGVTWVNMISLVVKWIQKLPSKQEVVVHVVLRKMKIAVAVVVVPVVSQKGLWLRIS